MITIKNIDIYGWESAIRGMRNPMNSWDKCDSRVDPHKNKFDIGPNDHTLMMKLAEAGSEHSKYRRMITVTMDITAPLYWWKEFDTYKVGTVTNSCSTMHKIHAKEFVLDDFSHEHFYDKVDVYDSIPSYLGKNSSDILHDTIEYLNWMRTKYLETKNKAYWWQLIQLLPSSYNQTRTVQLNYEVLSSIYNQRKNHKLDEWHTFCGVISELPYSEIIIGDNNET